MWGSLALAPATIVLHYATEIGDTAEFVLAAAALFVSPDRRRTVMQVGVAIVICGVVGVVALSAVRAILLTRVDEPDVGADLGREQLDHVVGQRLRGRDHLALLHEEAHDVGRRAVETGPELLRGRAPRDDQPAR